MERWQGENVSVGISSEAQFDWTTVLVEMVCRMVGNRSYVMIGKGRVIEVPKRFVTASIFFASPNKAIAWPLENGLILKKGTFVPF